MGDLIIWFQAHYAEIIQIILAVIGAASLIVKITPTIADDNILKGIIQFIGKWIALDKYGPNSGKT
jgi:hypothetical protein